MNTENRIITRGPRLHMSKLGREPREFTKEDAISMGNRIRMEREALGQSQLDLAIAVDVSERTIYSLETGNASPKFEVVRKLSDHFGVSIDYLVDGALSDEQEQVMKVIAETIKPSEIPYILDVLQLMTQWAEARK